MTYKEETQAAAAAAQPEQQRSSLPASLLNLSVNSLTRSLVRYTHKRNNKALQVCLFTGRICTAEPTNYTWHSTSQSKQGVCVWRGEWKVLGWSELP